MGTAVLRGLISGTHKYLMGLIREWERTLFKTLLTSLANSLEQTSKWNIFPQFETQAPRSCKDNDKGTGYICDNRR